MRRRTFIATAFSATRVLGANDRVRVGLIGCGGRGRYIARFMKESPGVDFIALCDVSAPLAESARQWAGPDAAAYGDFRKLLDNRDIDAIQIATPDHWHAAIAVAAIRAGKHVYIEKPLAYTVREGRAVVDAASQSKAVILPGSQQRSAPHYAEVEQMIREGDIGDVHWVRVWNFFNLLPNGIGRIADSPTPPGLDWDMYCGPAPLVPFNVRRFGPNFRYFRDYSGGVIADYGVHRFDTVHQIMHADSPRTVSASGGRFALDDMSEFPDTLQVTYEYPGWILTYDMSSINGHGMGGRTPGMRYYNSKGAEDRPHGEAFYGNKGTIVTDRLGYEVYFESDAKPPVRKNSADASALHARHFIACIRGLEKPCTNVLNLHRATNVAHLGNISYATGLKLHWDAEREQFLASAEADRLLARAPRKPWDLI
jgi:predicted dehydrogenase